MGGRFVEFVVNDWRRPPNLQDRMRRLLDDATRREVIRINNDVIASLPGPSLEIVEALREDLPPYSFANFQRNEEIPAANSDVWFRYATRAGAARWVISSRRILNPS